MAGGNRKNADHVFLTTLAGGETIENAAKAAGISERTAYRRLKDPEFSQQLQDLRADMVSRATGMLTAAATQAVTTLQELQHEDTPPAVRLGAARAVLELGMKLRESSELAERIAALEAELHSPTGTIPPTQDS